MNTLILTADERKIFDTLPATLKEGWMVEEETGNAYETHEELSMRQRMASFEDFPQLQALAQQVTGNRPLAEISLQEVPPEILPEFCFTIGARGLSALIALALRQAKDDEDIEGLAGFTSLRHEMLIANTSASPIAS